MLQQVSRRIPNSNRFYIIYLYYYSIGLHYTYDSNDIIFAIISDCNFKKVVNGYNIILFPLNQKNLILPCVSGIGDTELYLSVYVNRSYVIISNIDKACENNLIFNAKLYTLFMQLTMKNSQKNVTQRLYSIREIKRTRDATSHFRVNNKNVSYKI